MNPVAAIVRPAEQRIFTCAHGLAGHWDGPCTICDTLSAEKKADEREQARQRKIREREREKSNKNNERVTRDMNVENTQQSDAEISAEKRKAASRADTAAASAADLYAEFVDDNFDRDVASTESEIDPKNFLTAFLIRADQAKQFAVYSGPIDSKVIAMAHSVATAWSNLAQQMESNHGKKN